jgi:NADPH-dependent F420 reductase
VIGSRDADRARASAEEIGGPTTGATNVDAARDVDLAVLAVNAETALACVSELAAALGETPVLSAASALTFAAGGCRPDPDPRSLAERIQDELRGPVAAGLHTLAASNLGVEAPEQDALVCGDDPEAKALALELAGRVVAGRALDVGPLASARTLEGLTAVIVNVNRRYRAHAGVRVTGVR